jgi:hypothetical protein
LRYWGLNSGLTPWATTPAYFVIFFFFEIGSLTVFPWTGFELGAEIGLRFTWRVNSHRWTERLMQLERFLSKEQILDWYRSF